MPRLFTSLLVLLLGAWPSRARASAHTSRRRRGGLRPSGSNDERDPVDAPDRARTQGVHHWPGEIIFATPDRRTAVRGRWRLSLSAAQRAQASGSAGTLSLDPEFSEAWETQLASLLMLEVPGARMQVVRGNANGWQLLELRAPTQPETVVQLDRDAVAQLLDAHAEHMTVDLRVIA